MDRRDVYKHVVEYLKAGLANVRSDEAEMVCPNCGDDGNHFSVNVKKGVFNCYKCHFSGSLLPIISQNRSEWLSLVRTPHDGYRPSTGRVFSFCGTPLWQVDTGGVIREQTGETSTTAALRAEEYCLRRGMTKEQIKDYCVSIKPYDPRVYFPYWDDQGQLTFWMGRAIPAVIEPKTIEPEGAEKPLFGRHVKRLSGRLVILVEGVFDHFVTPCSYAIMGSAITGSQIATLRLDYVKRVILLQDPDAGQAMADNHKKLARFGILAHICSLGGSRDPADLGRKKMADVVGQLEAFVSEKTMSTRVHLKVN
jgi:hypothetical protein